MQHHIIKSLAAVALGAMLFSSCIMEKPTVKNYRKVSAMPELTPVTVEQLRQLIAADTTHYKVVVLTSPCCGYCVLSMRDVYPQKMAECDSSLVRWYFVVESYSSAQYADELYRTYHIDSPRYWIDDTLPQYQPLMVKNMWTVVWNLLWHYGQSFEGLGWEVADNRLNNIVNAIAPQPQLITGPNGTPTTVMLDPQGRMKCTYTIYNDSTAMLEPTDIRHITVPVTDLDYAHIDTLSYIPQNSSPVRGELSEGQGKGRCTPDGKCN